MARTVWILTTRIEDVTEGSDIEGVYTSVRKAKVAAREHAGLEKGSRAIKWEESVKGSHFGTHCETYVKDYAFGESDPHEETQETHYHVGGWTVR